MGIKITKKIKGYTVIKPEDAAKAKATADAIENVVTPPDNDALTLPRGAEVIQMHEKVERPDVLIGSTHKIKSPLFEHALYVTINDVILNQGTEHELRRPFEIFINSKNMDHFQWIVALTRIMSAVFRKGGDVTFLVEEMKAVFDPRGGYFKSGGVYMPSIVAEIGAVVEDHLKMIGLIHDPEVSPEQRKLINEKRAAYEASLKKNPEVTSAASDDATTPQPSSRRMPGPSGEAPGSSDYARPGQSETVRPEVSKDERATTSGESSAFPPSATLCHKCSTKAVIIMDGCATCLNCGYSKCG